MNLMRVAIADTLKASSVTVSVSDSADSKFAATWIDSRSVPTNVSISGSIAPARIINGRFASTVARAQRERKAVVRSPSCIHLAKFGWSSPAT